MREAAEERLRQAAAQADVAARAASAAHLKTLRETRHASESELRRLSEAASAERATWRDERKGLVKELCRLRKASDADVAAASAAAAAAAAEGAGMARLAEERAGALSEAMRATEAARAEVRSRRSFEALCARVCPGRQPRHYPRHRRRPNAW